MPSVGLALMCALPLAAVASLGTPARGSAQGAARGAQDPAVRVAVVIGARSLSIGATGPWRVYSADGRTLLYRPASSDSWRFEPVGGRVWGSARSGLSMPARSGGVVLRPVDPEHLLTLDGRRYRGEVAVIPAAAGLTAVNRLGLESYLRGVVPLEIGRRTGAELAAIMAQAVAARSYAHTRMRTSSRQQYDLVGTVLNQVYGGAGAETELTDAAVRDTRGIVLHYGGRPIDGQYHAHCGGRTAAASEVYAGASERPYLRSVSDRIPGSDAHYCDIYPPTEWSRTLDARQVNASIERYLRDHVAGVGRLVGSVRSIEETGRTQSGRIAALRIRTDRGTHVVRGNAIRFVLRPSNGEILPSTYFSARAARDARGNLATVTFEGRGNGHGVGMCQWGAIGRARAGQSWQSILQTYYPGTKLENIY